MSAAEEMPAEVPEVPSPSTLAGSEVLELERFLEKRAWIEEKIQFLEALPPLDAYHGFADPVEDGEGESAKKEDKGAIFPSREELDRLVEEHDRIEDEAEQFDSGDMKRLKAFAKAASQKNLSPSDTDLIEVTLTTLFALDKLLHLLQTRSASLHLTSLRLTWDAQRADAWSEYASLQSGIDNLVNVRARWQPPSSSSTTTPSASVAAAPSSPTSVLSPSRTRSASLSLDATQYVARTSTLRHGAVTTAGNTLEKMIDARVGKLPDEMLDEQDRLENQADALVERGMWAGRVVQQWKKADELYGSLQTAQASASALISQIAQAKSSHPDAAQHTLHTSTLSFLHSSIASTPDPASALSGFPRPTHASYPDQPRANELIARALSAELGKAREDVEKAGREVRWYGEAVDKVRRAERLRGALERQADELEGLERQLREGVATVSTNGSRPDLTREDVAPLLEHDSFSTYLSTLPHLSSRVGSLVTSASSTLREAELALVGLRSTGASPAFTISVSAAAARVRAALHGAQAAQTSAQADADALRESKDVARGMEELLEQAGQTRRGVEREIQRAKWRGRADEDVVPLPVSSPGRSSADLVLQLSNLRTFLVAVPLDTLVARLEPYPRLAEHLRTKRDAADGALRELGGRVRLLEGVRDQRREMQLVLEEGRALERSLQSLHERADSACSAVRSGHEADDASLQSELDTFSGRVEAFSTSLATRIPFLSSPPPADRAPASDPPPAYPTPPPSLAARSTQSSPAPELSDLPDLDAIVRADANALAASLAGHVDDVRAAVARVDLERRAGEVVLALEAFGEVVREGERLLGEKVEEVETWKKERVAALDDPDADVDAFQASSDAALTALRASIEPALSTLAALPAALLPARTALSHLLNASPPPPPEIAAPRREAFEKAEGHLKEDRAARLCAKLEQACEGEMRRVGERKREVEERWRSGEERREKEEAERREREEAEGRERVRLEAAQREKEEAEEWERTRLEAEEAARTAEREAAEAVTQEQSPPEAGPSDAAPTSSTAAAPLLPAVSIRSPTDTPPASRDDVFGPRIAVASAALTTEQEDSVIFAGRVGALTRRVLDLGVEDLVAPLDPSPFTELPTPAQTADVAAALDELRKEADLLREDAMQVDVVDFNPLEEAFARKEELLGRLRKLSLFQDEVERADAALSNLLDAIDGTAASRPSSRLSTSSSLSNLSASSRLSASSSTSRLANASSSVPHPRLSAYLAETDTCVQAVRSAAAELEGDDRVAEELRRVECAWEEMREMAQDRLEGRRPGVRSRTDSVASVGSTVASSRRTPMLHKSASLRSIASSPRSLSTPTRPPAAPAPAAAKQRPRLSTSAVGARPSGQTAQKRVVSNPSDATPTSKSTLAKPPPGRSSASSSSAVRRPRASLSSNPSASASSTPRAPSRPRSRVQSVARTESPRSMGPTSPARTPRRTSFTSSTSGASPRQHSASRIPAPVRRNAYRPNPRSKLDVAVGRVVNSLPVDIDIQPASARSPKWDDPSGKYWIGAPDPKMCFCRILRSNTVMVRVGGGWQELSKFLFTHFSHFFTMQSPVLSRVGSEEPRWISSATLLSPSSAASPSSPASQGRATTLPLPASPSGSVRSARSAIAGLGIIGTPTSSPSSAVLFPRSPGSPEDVLMPLFMRPAVDSPPSTTAASPAAAATRKKPPSLSSSTTSGSGPQKRQPWRY